MKKKGLQRLRKDKQKVKSEKGMRSGTVSENKIIQNQQTGIKVRPVNKEEGTRPEKAM